MKSLSLNPRYFVLFMIVGQFLVSTSAHAHLITLEEKAFFMNAEAQCGLAYDPNQGAEESSVGLVWEGGFVEKQPMFSGLRVPGEDNFTQIDRDAEDSRGNRLLTTYSYFDEESGEFVDLSFAWVEVESRLWLLTKETVLGTCQKAVRVSEAEFRDFFFKQLRGSDFYRESNPPQ